MRHAKLLPLVAVIVCSQFWPATAFAQRDYRQIARFSDGDGELVLTVVYKPRGGPSINVRFNRFPLGSSLFLHRKEWAVFAGWLGRISAAPDGAELKFDDLDTPGTGYLRVAAYKRGPETHLTLTRIEHKGGRYPDLVFQLPPRDFAEFLKAVDAVAEELAKD